MIDYDVRACCGVSVVLQMSGSVAPQALVPACVSILVACLVLLEYGDPEEEEAIALASNSSVPVHIFRDFLRHPYPHQITSVMIGFMMVFRVQLSYSRYWGAAMPRLDPEAARARL